MSVRLPVDLRARIDDYRLQKRMSVNGTIIAALLAFLPPSVPRPRVRRTRSEERRAILQRAGRQIDMGRPD